jgi:hypothetical protein
LTFATGEGNITDKNHSGTGKSGITVVENNETGTK